MNYHHLHYFWVVATEGGMARAAERLDVAVQTVSSQVHALERSLGVSLLKPEGRGLTLTDAGRIALREADEIFRRGSRLPELLHSQARERTIKLNVGLSDGLPKLLVHQLLQPVLEEPHLQLRCTEDRTEELLAALALHRIDLVLCDQAPPVNPNLKLYVHPLTTSGLSWYASARWYEAAAHGFPGSLAEVPVLLPTRHALVRSQLDRWFEAQGIRPRIQGEFQDSALLKTFGASGLGVFPVVDRVHADVEARYGVQRVGAADGVEERVLAVAADKRIQHPLVARLLGR